MNKLISKNPVQRFKQGRKIVKGYDGLAGIALQQGDNANAKATPVNRGISQNALRSTSNKYAKLAKIGRGLRKFTKFSAPAIIGGFIGDWIGNKLWNSVYNDALEEGLQEREINRLILSNALRKSKRMQFNANQRLKEIEEIDELNQSKKVNSQDKPTDNKSSKKLINKPINNYYVKGFENRKEELAKQGKTVRDIQKMLGFTGKDLDGKWGKNTEAAYLKYLNKQAPELPTSQQLVEHVQNQMKPVETNIQPSVYQQMSQLTNGFTQTPTLSKTTSTTTTQMPSQYEDMLRGKYKIGGQLPSRNIVKRFKNRKFN